LFDLEHCLVYIFLLGIYLSNNFQPCAVGGSFCVLIHNLEVYYGREEDQKRLNSTLKASRAFLTTSPSSIASKPEVGTIFTQAVPSAGGVGRGCWSICREAQNKSEAGSWSK